MFKDSFLSSMEGILFMVMGILFMVMGSRDGGFDAIVRQGNHNDDDANCYSGLFNCAGWISGNRRSTASMLDTDLREGPRAPVQPQRRSVPVPPVLLDSSHPVLQELRRNMSAGNTTSTSANSASTAVHRRSTRSCSCASAVCHYKGRIYRAGQP